MKQRHLRPDRPLSGQVVRRDFRGGRFGVLPFPHAILILALSILANRPAHAHDGHAPLPTKGASVQGNQLMLSESARKSIGVEAAKVTLADLEKSVQSQCQIRLPWHQQAQVTTLLSGRILKVMARPGDKVEQGQELAEVASPEFETVQRDLLKAIAAKKLSDRLLAQRESLVKTNTIPTELLIETRRQTEETAAGVEVANRKLLAIGLNQAAIDQVIASETPIRTLSIRSPMKGEVAKTDVRVGQVVARDEHLFHIVDLSKLEFAGEVIETDVPAVRIGQSVKASFTALPGQVFSGVVEHTELEVDERLHTLTVVAHAENPGGQLKPGMSGRMTIMVAKAEQAIVCPVAAIFGPPTNPHVFLDRATSRFDRRPVKLGLRAGNQVEIVDGLFPGDRVVVVGAGVMTSLMSPLPKSGDQSLKSQAVLKGAAGVRTEPRGSNQIRPIEALGEIEVPIDRRHFAAPQVEGRIARILVHPGEDVRQGQVLAEVASLPVFTLQLELLQNQARARWLREKTSRLRSLDVSQAVKKIDLWQAETDLEILEHKISESRSQLKALGLEEKAIVALEAVGLDPTRRDLAGMIVVPIRAPAAGRLDHFELVPGQVVKAAEPGQTEHAGSAFEIHDRSKVWVRAYVREGEASRIRLGQAATLSFPALPGNTVSGTVVRVSPIFDPVSRVMPIWVETDNPSGHLFENMHAKVTIDAATATTPEPARPN